MFFLQLDWSVLFGLDGFDVSSYFPVIVWVRG
jgi:hypothetical protein